MKPLFEKVPERAGESFLYRENKATSFSMPWHFHPELELTYIVAGEGMRHVGDHVAPFGPGDLVLLGPDLPHFWSNGAASDGTCHSVVVQFPQRLVDEVLSRLPEAAPIVRLLAAAGRGIHFDITQARAIGSRLRALHRAAPWPRWLGLVAILGDLARSRKARRLASAGFVPVLDPRAGARIAAVCDYVAREHAGTVHHRVAARLAGMSPAAFSRYFRRHLGRTFEAYVNEVRVGRACLLLLDTDRSVSEVAYAVGYNNLANFYRRFRAITGQTPTRFRRSRTVA